MFRKAFHHSAYVVFMFLAKMLSFLLHNSSWSSPSYQCILISHILSLAEYSKVMTTDFILNKQMEEQISYIQRHAGVVLFPKYHQISGPSQILLSLLTIILDYYRIILKFQNYRMVFSATIDNGGRWVFPLLVSLLLKPLMILY